VAAADSRHRPRARQLAGPIKSIAGSLDNLLQRDPPPEDWRDDMRRGLQVIESRTDSLSRFTGASARLARLPAPKLAPVVLKPLIQRVAAFDTRVPIVVKPGPDVTIDADADQLEQLLINLMRNAADACLEVGSGGTVSVGWRRTRSGLEIAVEDEGPGLANTSNLFVPFFTTKPAARHWSCALPADRRRHGGTLTLENRKDARGCRARLTLPV
jgi:signal transduction histidine kinase